MASRSHSRWRVILEARDSLLRILVPAVSLRHFLVHGRTIAHRLAINRPQRPMQLTQTTRILGLG